MTFEPRFLGIVEAWCWWGKEETRGLMKWSYVSLVGTEGALNTAVEKEKSNLGLNRRWASVLFDRLSYAKYNVNVDIY